MTRDDDFIGQLEGYLDEYEGITPLPAEVRDVIRAELPTTSQQGLLGGLLGRNLGMTNIVRFGIAAAAVILVAFLGIEFLPWSTIGGPTATPTATASPTQRASSPYVITADQVPSLGTHQMTFAVPEGWTDSDGKGVHKDSVSLTVWVSPSGIWVNPCYWDLSPGAFADPPFYRSMDILLEAFWDWWGRPEPGGFGNWAGGAQATLPSGTEPLSTELDGWDARYTEFRAPTDLDLTSCVDGEYRIWVDVYGQIKAISAPGELNRVWLLKVGLPDIREGGFVLIDASSSPSSSTQDLAELQAIVDSIRIETP